jgi:hypothetical protein
MYIYIYMKSEALLLKRFNIELNVLAALITSLGLVQLIPISGSTLLSPATAQQPPVSTEIAAPGEKQNEYYIFTRTRGK